MKLNYKFQKWILNVYQQQHPFILISLNLPKLSLALPKLSIPLLTKRRTLILEANTRILVTQWNSSFSSRYSLTQGVKFSYHKWVKVRKIRTFLWIKHSISSSHSQLDSTLGFKTLIKIAKRIKQVLHQLITSLLNWGSWGRLRRKDQPITKL